MLKVTVCVVRKKYPLNDQGNGWEGIDAHWRAKHNDLMTYEEFWNSLCIRHRE